jgi:hypothetical protein
LCADIFFSASTKLCERLPFDVITGTSEGRGPRRDMQVFVLGDSSLFVGVHGEVMRLLVFSIQCRVSGWYFKRTDYNDDWKGPYGSETSVCHPGANTAQYAGVGNPIGLSNNNAFGRIWPANAPFGTAGIGSSSILDPTGQPLASPPNNLIGGIYAGALTDRNVVTAPPQPQVIAGSLSTGAVGTAMLGPSPDGSCKAVFVVVTADGAIVQEHTLKGLDGLAPPGTIRPLLGHR